MATQTMNISLPVKLKAFVDRRVSTGGYGSHSEYVRELVRRDQERAAVERLRGLIQEGLDSGEGPSWEELRAELTASPPRGRKRKSA
jgi:antitoxin ParD1/3/4